MSLESSATGSASQVMTDDDSFLFQSEIDHHSEFVKTNFENIQSKVNLLKEGYAVAGVPSSKDELLEPIKLFKQIPTIHKQAHEETRNFREKEKEYMNEINTYKQKILELKEQLKIKNGGRDCSEYDPRHIQKMCKRAISKYTTTFNFDIEVQDVQENEYTAVIKFKGQQNMPIMFVIDRKKRSVKHIDATSTGKCVEKCSEENGNENLKGVLHKLRELVLQNKI